MTPRPRSKKSAGLPPNLYVNNDGATFKYRRPDTGTWHGMGADKQKAIAAARQLNSLLMAGSDLVAGVMGDGQSVEAFIEVYRGEILPGRELAAATLKLYATRFRQIIAAFGAKACDSVTIRDVSAMLEAMPARSANQTRSLLSDMFRHMIARGLASDNPAAQTIERIEKKRRQRHTVEALAKIRAAAPSWLQNAIDIALLTTARREEVIAMKFDEIRDGFLYVIQQKTAKKSDSAFIRYKVTPQLEAVIKRCRDELVSPFLIHRRNERMSRKSLDGKQHWTEVHPNKLSREFDKARTAAGVYKDLDDDELPGFHEVRALALHLYELAGKPQDERRRLAGHSNEKMTRNYEKDHEVIAWSDAVPDLDIRAITGG